MVSKDTVSYFDLPVLGRRNIIYDSASWFAHCGVMQFVGESVNIFFFASLDTSCESFLINFLFPVYRTLFRGALVLHRGLSTCWYCTVLWMHIEQ